MHPIRDEIAVVQQTHSPGHSGGVERSGYLRIIDPATGEVKVERELSLKPWCVAYSPDGKLLAIGTNENRVILMDTHDYAVQLQWVAHDQYIYALDWISDGTRLVTSSGDASLKVWDTRTRITTRKEREAMQRLKLHMATHPTLEQEYPQLRGLERQAARLELLRHANSQ